MIVKLGISDRCDKEHQGANNAKAGIRYLW